MKQKTRADLIKTAIAEFKVDNPDWKKLNQHDLYGVESYIDGLLYEKAFQHLAPGYGGDDPEENDELVLERFTFAAIKILQSGKRHTCDPYYDPAFNGYDEL